MTLPIFLLLTGNKNADAMLPFAIPGSETTRMAFAMINADRQAKKQAAAEERIVEDAFKAANIKSPTELGTNFPALSAAFNKLPAASQKRILDAVVASAPPPGGDREVAFSPITDSSTSSASRSSRAPSTQPSARTP